MSSWSRSSRTIGNSECGQWVCLRTSYYIRPANRGAPRDIPASRLGWLPSPPSPYPAPPRASFSDKFKIQGLTDRICLSLYFCFSLRVFLPISSFPHFLREPGASTFIRILLLSKAGYTLIYMDEFVDQLLTEERVCDIILPRLTKREVLEETEGLAPRSSALLKAMEESGSEDEGQARERKRRSSSRSSRSRSSSRVSGDGSVRRSRSESGSDRGRYVSRSPSRSRSRSRGTSPTGSAARYRSRSRDISPDRMQED